MLPNIFASKGRVKKLCSFLTISASTASSLGITILRYANDVHVHGLIKTFCLNDVSVHIRYISFPVLSCDNIAIAHLIINAHESIIQEADIARHSGYIYHII